jgi:hypothetical protein
MATISARLAVTISLQLSRDETVNKKKACKNT